jgi:hypothetical protein
MQQISKTGIASAEDGIDQNKRALRRERLMDEVIGQLHTQARAKFENCPLERIPEGDTRALVLRIPMTELRIDFITEYRWGEITKDDVASVFAAGRVRPDSIAYGVIPCAYDVCSLTSENVTSVVDALLTRFVEQVGAAIDIAELNGGKLTAAVNLDQGNT